MTLDDRLHALVDEHLADSDEARRTALRHALSRRLLDDPVIYTDELDPDARAYFVNQRGADGGSSLRGGRTDGGTAGGRAGSGG